ncbi:hypothetical protein [Polynucleobacter sp.]|uniref:hypothetical protein n=1 Tax=Polynucleobacter sp. TaxID=2029855 RepID=UPI003F69C2E1
MGYTTKKNIENYLKRELSSTEDGNIELLILATDQAIDAYCGRTFSKNDDEEVTRYYDGSGTNDLIIDDFMSITSVELVDIDENNIKTFETDEYVTYPLNSETITRVHGYGTWFPRGHKNVRIIGVPGYSIDVPEAIQLAATMMISSYITNPQNLTKESIEGYSREFGPSAITNDVSSLLDSYKRIML